MKTVTIYRPLEGLATSTRNGKLPVETYTDIKGLSFYSDRIVFVTNEGTVVYWNGLYEIMDNNVDNQSI